MKRRLLSATASCLALAAASGAWAQEHEFNIPAQGLDSALTQYSEQSDQQVLYASAVVEGREAPAVIGTYTEEEALDLLLDDELTYMQGAGDAIIIRTAASEQVETIDNDDDNNNGDYEDDSDLETDEVIVTGTNIRGVENPTVPVLQFDREDIDLSGAATVDDFLRTIPQNFASQTQLTAQSGNPNTSPNVTQGTTVDLRGLGAGSTLTLLNGRRMTPAGNSNFVDINVLPLGVIERVDVLTDGATAVYGSDAVGGVINFVTRKDYEGFDVNARYGTVTEGSKEDWGVGAAGGFNWGSGGVFAGVDYQEQTPLLATERDFVDLLLPSEGTRFGSDSERFSVAGGVNQALGAKISFGVDILYTDILNESNSVASALPRIDISEQNTIFINSQIEYKLTDEIIASVFMDYANNDVKNNNLLDDEINEFGNELFLYEGRLSGQLFTLPGGQVSFSIGGLYREEDYTVSNSLGFALSGARSVSAGYAEVLVPIVGSDNALPFVQSLELSLAGRYEDYSDVGDSLDPKIGVFWEINNELSLRASYSESFRAPDLQTLNGGELWFIIPFPTSSITAFPAPPPSPLSPPFFDAALIAFLAGFNSNLGPESANSWSAGFTYQPEFLNGLTIQGNFFDISYADRIEDIGLLLILSDPSLGSLVNTTPLLEAQELFNRAETGEIRLSNQFGATPEDVQILANSGPQNLSIRDVRGFDLNINYSVDTNAGRFSAGANASYLVNYIQQLNELSPIVDQVNVLYRPVDFKMRANLSWSNNGFTAFTALNYVDGYRDKINTLIANGIDAWTTVDLSLAYDTTDRFDSFLINDLRFGLSVTNLFDNDPPFVATPFGLNYDSANANPFNRQISVTLSKRF